MWWVIWSSCREKKYLTFLLVERDSYLSTHCKICKNNVVLVTLYFSKDYKSQFHVKNYRGVTTFRSKIMQILSPPEQKSSSKSENWYSGICLYYKLSLIKAHVHHHHEMGSSLWFHHTFHKRPEHTKWCLQCGVWLRRPGSTMISLRSPWTQTPRRYPRRAAVPDLAVWEQHFFPPFNWNDWGFEHFNTLFYCCYSFGIQICDCQLSI